MNPLERFVRQRKGIFWIGVLTLAVNFFMLWLLNRPIPYDKNIFYWPLALELFVNLYCPSTLASVLLIILIVTYSIKHFSKWKKIIVISFSSLVGLLIVYISFVIPWVTNTVYHHDSAKFNDKIYHVTITRKFDRGGKVLFGECDQNRYYCEFHHILEIGYIDYDTKNLELQANKEKITITDNSTSNPDGKIVYSFDGFSEKCIPDDGGLSCPFQ